MPIHSLLLGSILKTEQRPQTQQVSKSKTIRSPKSQSSHVPPEDLRRGVLPRDVGALGALLRDLEPVLVGVEVRHLPRVQDGGHLRNPGQSAGKEPGTLEKKKR